MIESLKYSGREANHTLNFRRWSESKHAQYFTPLELAKTIAKCISLFVPLEGLNVLDPTCGTGRLLKPFQDAGSNVIGIELDKDTAFHTQKILGSKCVRVGDICEYRSHLKNQFDVVVTNPPYGITWRTREYFQTSRYDESIESQSATMEICSEALRYYGYLIAVIPTSTFTNEKDKQLKEFLYSNFVVMAKITLENLFLEEYGITPKVDLIFAQKGYVGHGEKQSPLTASWDYRDSNTHEQIERLIAEAKERQISDAELDKNPKPPDVPNLSLLKIIRFDPTLRLTENGVVGDHGSVMFAQFLDKFDAYNPVLGKETGAWEAYCSKPALLKRGVEAAEFFLRSAGFDLSVPNETRLRLERAKQKYARLAIPIYRPEPHQLLAYFDEKPYIAKAAVTDSEGLPLFQKEKEYMFRPTWVRNRETVKREVKTVNDKKVTFIHDVDRGYLAFSIQTESGLRTFKEVERTEIDLLTQAFDLPKIKDVADYFPELVEANREKITKQFPFLFEYQKEDLARLMLKDRIYLGYEMGGGKTVTGACWAALKGYRRILVISQPAAANNWERELKKFGFAVHKLLNHRAVNELLVSSKQATPTFYVTSYQFLSLDTQRVYDPWTCVKHDKDGRQYHLKENNTGRTCSDCGCDFESVQRTCPKCEDHESWTGGHCHHCGYQAWTYTNETTQYPAYKRLKKGVFDCILIDEAQEAKSKNSFRGRAIRAIKTKGVALLTGTLMKGYISDVFWNIGKLVGFGNLLFPYPYRGGAKMFLDEFGTYEYVSQQFADTLHEGRARLLPEVSNLNRFWRILASFTVRRLKDTMVELPPKQRHYEMIRMTGSQSTIYRELEKWAQEEIQKALRDQDEPNMGKISNALWKLRFAATVPTDADKLGDYAIENDSWAKLERIVELVREIKARREQVVIFASLRSMVQAISERLKRNGLKHVKITATSDVQKRLALIDEFQSDGAVALVAGTNCANRAFTITSANNVIIANLEFSPEPTVQAEDRVHRTGQTKPVNVYYLLSENTIDQDMWELITKKGEAIQHAIDMKARDVSVAELLQSKAEIEVAIRVLGRQKLETVAVPTPAAKQVQTPKYLPLSSRKKRQKSRLEFETSLQTDLFFEIV